MPNRYRLKGESLEDVRRKAELQYGPAARVVSADRVISPGIAGLFSGDYYEAVVEVLDPNPATGGPVRDAQGKPVVRDGSDGTPREASRFSRMRRGAAAFMGPAQVAPTRVAPAAAAARTAAPAQAAPAPVRAPEATKARPTPEEAGFPAAASHHLQGAAIAALLAEADTVELGMHRPRGTGVSTESPDFAELLEQLGAGLNGGPGREDVTRPPGPQDAGPTKSTTPPAARPGPPPAPAPLNGIGDLVLLIGLGEDALDTALAMSIAAGGADVRTAGKLTAFGHLHVDGRQSATAARAQAVMTDRTVLVAYGLERSRDAAATLNAVSAISADQIWVVVDAGRKHEDTARWVHALGAQLPISALAVVGTAETSTPESVNELGVPVGWIDSRQARSGQL